jgi:hypothetical protein
MEKSQTTALYNKMNNLSFPLNKCAEFQSELEHFIVTNHFKRRDQKLTTQLQPISA